MIHLDRKSNGEIRQCTCSIHGISDGPCLCLTALDLSADIKSPIYDCTIHGTRLVPCACFKSIDSNVESVREKLKTRAEHGLAKYGVTTERTDIDLRGWLNHLQQEQMDSVVYIERILNQPIDPEASIYRDAAHHWQKEWRNVVSKLNSAHLEIDALSGELATARTQLAEALANLSSNNHTNQPA